VRSPTLSISRLSLSRLSRSCKILGLTVAFEIYLNPRNARKISFGFKSSTFLPIILSNTSTISVDAACPKRERKVTA